MTDVNCLTSEHIATTTSTATAAAEAAQTTSPPRTPTRNGLEQLALEPTSPFVLRAPPSAKSKLILQNMEEVLYSVKQKHREKHKRKREEKRRAALLAETQERPLETGSKPQPLREKAAQENGLKNGKRKSSPLKCSTPVAEHHSILKHFPKAGRPENGAPAPPAKAKSATNVFEFMMNARNRSIGVNDGGKDACELPADQAEAAAPGTPTSKRKQLLQEWNERKGGAKRRLQEEAREEYIDQQMDQRAKRLKKMLSKTEEPKEPQEPPPAASSAPTVPVKRGRGRPRTRRLSSVDVNVIPAVPSEDTDTAEFLAKLSSPTKKRDSLLGYFPKVESPKEPSVTIETPPLDTPKRRPLRRKTIVEATPIDVEATGTPPGRPRRSCAGKARYDYDLETSPTKAKAGEAAAAAKKSQKAEDLSIEIIDLDNSNPVSTPKKLAPLFVRQLPKPSPDPSVLKARQAFLQSGVPEKIRQEQSRQKNFEQYYEESYEAFPSIAHVGCESYETIREGSPLLLPSFPLRKNDGEEVSLPSNKRRSKAASGYTSCQAADWHQAYNSGTKKTAYTTLPQLDNKRAFVKLWKNKFERFPTFKCYNQMREKYRHFSAIDSAQDTQQMGESFVVTRRTLRKMEQFDHGSTEEAKPPLSAPNGEVLFTEKYKPLLFEQVLVNLTPVQDLREFLSGWNGNGGRSSQTFDDTSFDFGNDSSSVGAASNTMVLVGPSSSGKTNAVIALANDMNFNVLEINAGMKRTGKKLIQELQEATQSHQIRKDSKMGGGSSQQLLQKLQKSGLKAKKQQQQQQQLQQGEPAGVEAVRKSLILIEDADILFDNMDAGFTDAIYTLAASSKRPVVVVASDPNCAHLQRLMQQNQIHFQAPNALNISRFLAVLALMENCPIELDELISLYLYNQQNLRKTLMELQFYIQSGGDLKGQAAAASQQSLRQSPSKSATRLATVDGCHIHQRLFEFFTCCQNVQHRIPFPVDFRLLRLNLSDLMAGSPLLRNQQPPAATRANAKRKSRSPKKAWLSSATSQQRKSEEPSAIATLAAFYDNLSQAAAMDANQDCGDRLQLYLSEDISHTLVEQALFTGLSAKECAYNLFDKPAPRVTIGEHLGIGQLRSASSKALDYEPVLRSICRSEKERVGQERKSSRFYHYLRNHTVNVTTFAMDSFDSACSVFQEEVAGAMAGPSAGDSTTIQ
ncbi:ATPase family AAA domain-containing protein 5 [Drosophila madeirensis]|uniref:ATPase family AAA domain-containing protein 5 n=1 Tax=Drosophila madeirensis TaxID=30013 RepID=A0AAU9FUJ7_DROMD